MKVLRYLVAAALLVGMTGVANAFQFKVLDPPSGPGYAIVVPGQPFNLDFVACPIASIGDGCFLGFNFSDQDLTSLDFTFPDTTALGGQAASCQTVGTLFTNADCSLSDGVYTLDFSGGTGISPYSFFFVIEDGVTAGDFPEVTAIANTPEPGSLWLALSGCGLLGYAVWSRRKNLIA